MGLSAVFSTANAARPECVYASSDFDGDGFGFENDQTCLITENSTGQPPTSMECIDSDADGWGWNGTTSCRVEIPESSCVDTDPRGDGWGWDGVTSCRVGSLTKKFSEIEEITEHFTVTAPSNSVFSKAAAVLVRRMSSYLRLLTTSHTMVR